jgi:hypothetical protein
MGGMLAMRSQPGHGTMFRIDLPAVAVDPFAVTDDAIPVGEKA